jgi:hypothetical protein
MNKHLFVLLGDLGFGVDNDQPQPVMPDWANAPMPYLFGCEVEYSNNGYPASRHLARRELDNMCTPGHIELTPLFKHLQSQSEQIEKQFEVHIEPWWNTQGILNLLLLIVGDDSLVGLQTEDKELNDIIQAIYDTMTCSVEWMLEHESHPDCFVHYNCSVALISPKTYKNMLWPWELKLYERMKSQGLPYGIHHCGKIDRYLPIYRELPQVDMLEIGWGSDLKETLTMFPETSDVYLIFDHKILSDATPKETLSALKKIEDNSSGFERLTINFADNDADTRMENVRAALDYLKGE